MAFNDQSMRHASTRAVARRAALDPTDPTRVREVVATDNKFDNSIEASDYLASITPQFASNRTLIRNRHIRHLAAQSGEDD